MVLVKTSELEQIKAKKSTLIQEQKYEEMARLRDYEKLMMDVINFKS